MEITAYSAIDGAHGVFRPSGQVSTGQAVGIVAKAIAWAREHGARKLLVNTSGWMGLRPPSVAERYFFIKDWAKAAGGEVRVAVVAPLYMIDPEKFGETVARNFGFAARVFTSEDEAAAWLDGSSNEETCPEPLQN